MYKYEKKFAESDFFIVELSANGWRFGFYIKPSSKWLICNVVS